jgi:1-acyl-sn-glycerol-3-phosphate acyltransferase
MSYEKWSFRYWLLKQYVRFADWIIHRKITLINTKNIPKNKPIILAPNHQNALSDPLAILLHTPLQPVWLARADIFKNKTVAAILRFLKIMPIYRLRDGKENLAKNEQTFAQSIKVLQHNGALGLFPEGAHTGKRQMIAHKKAVPRIVFMADEKAEEKLDTHVIPTGIYYSSYWKFNRDVLVNFGPPINTKEFIDEYYKNPNAATIAMRQKIYEGIEKQIINIKSKEHYQDFVDIISFCERNFLQKNNKKNNLVNRFLSNQKLARALDALEFEKNEELSDLIEKIREYKKLIKKWKLRNWLLEDAPSNLFKIPLLKLFLLSSLPIFIYGFIFNALPFFIIDTLVRKKIKDIAFWSTFSLVLGLVLFPLFYLIQLIVIGWLLPGIWLKLAFVLSLPFAGKAAFKWYILFRKTTGRVRLFYLQIFKRKAYKNLQQKREELNALLEKLILTQQ